MEIYETVRSEDGSFTQNYKQTVKDIHGNDVEILADSRVVRPVEIRARILRKTQEMNEAVTNYQKEIDDMSAQLTSIENLG